jgi:hypothetical protein
MIRHELRPIEGADQFERFCCEVAKDVFGDYAAYRYGRNGQAQNGIDIVATNRKAGGGSIVIQCKHKALASMPSVAAIAAELREDFASAISHHQFDDFVFAGTWLRDKHLQDTAEELSRTSGKRVRIWSRDDLADHVNVHPRLQRLFGQGHADHGIKLIDIEFVENLRLEAADPFSFYSGLAAGDLQWSGVARGFDAARVCRATIDQRIDCLFSKDRLDAKVAAVVHGEGGCGKSTLLRRIAIDRAMSGDCVCWWVESLGQFLHYDAIAISESPQSRHLVFIDDWYRNVRSDDYAEFLVWLRSQQRVLVVIGDRNAVGRPYMQQLYGAPNALHELLPAENQGILQTVLAAMGNIAVSDARFWDYVNVVGQSPLFVVLFVLSHAAQSISGSPGPDFDDGIEARFRTIIARRLQKLERDERHRGLGRAVVLLAHLYVAEETPWQSFGEDFLIHAASFFAGPAADTRMERPQWQYPAPLSALMHRELDRRGNRFCRFNHDVIAERGVVGIRLTAPELDIDLDPRHGPLHDLLDYLIEHRVAGGAVVLWCWLAHRANFPSEEHLLGKLEMILRLCAQAGFFPSLTTVFSSLPSRESRGRLCRVLLNDVDLLVGLGPGSCVVLKNPAHVLAAKDAARAILATENFVALPFAIVCTALNIVSHEDAGKIAARAILASENFVALPFAIVSTALNIVAHEDAGKIAARTILATEDFIALPEQIVSTALSVLRLEEAGRTAALRVIMQAHRTSTFIEFSALRALALATDESMRSIAEDAVRRACTPPFDRRGSLRLSYDLQFLPFARVTAHRKLTLDIAGRYHPEGPMNLKKNVFKILRCRLEYGPQDEIVQVVDVLCERVAHFCVEDMEYQWRVHPGTAQLGHIWTSLELLGRSTLTDRALARLQVYEADHPGIRDWGAFEHLMAKALAVRGDDQNDIQVQSTAT